MKDEELLRRVLETEASKVEVSMDALAEIRRRIAARRPWWQSGRFAMFTGTFAVATVAAVAVGVVSCQPNPTSAPPQTGSSQTEPAPPSPSVPSLSAPPSASVPAGPPDATEATVGGTGAATLAVYYVGTDPQLGPRLYREFHRISTGNGSAAGKTRAALTEMVGRTARDPDYSTPWPGNTRIRDVRVSGDTVTVDLTGAGAGPADDRTARIAVQQLVWTATAASGKPNVRLLLDGRAAQTLWGKVPVGGTLRRAPAQDTLGLVWLISPQDGDRVGRTVKVHLYGSVFEATIHLRVRQGSRTVTEQAVTVNAGPPAFGEATVTLTLAPGKYVLEAYEVSMRDGSAQHLDDHDVTVG
jgi:Sporulation and spore germination/Immunoglobulin-like domain of bacterial spore germination